PTEPTEPTEPTARPDEPAPAAATERPTPQAPPNAPSRPQRRPEDIPGIAPQAIAGAIQGRMPYAQSRCFERRRRRVPNLGGIVTIGFTVRPDGRADDVNVVHNGTGDEWFGNCIRNVVRGTRFPQARNGHDTPARYPFRF
ncbi:MAG: TonB family protein, partial [Myxococcales bacterium]|nr:TonB family protein [Myxococcales bacterium]